MLLIVAIGPPSAEDSILGQAGYTLNRFMSFELWWQEQPTMPAAFVVDVDQPIGHLNGFQISRVIKQMVSYRAVPILLVGQLSPNHQADHYATQIDAICPNIYEMLPQLGALTTLYQRLAPEPLKVTRVEHLMQVLDTHVCQQKLQHDVDKLSALLPDVESSIHMAFSLFESVAAYSAAAVVVQSNQVLIPDEVYISTPHFQSMLSPLTRDYLLGQLPEVLPFDLTAAPRVHNLQDLDTAQPLLTFEHCRVLPFTHGAKTLGALVFWGTVPLTTPLIDCLPTVLEGWFRQLYWARQVLHNTILDSVTHAYQHTYLMQQLHNEVKRATRYEYPICVMKVVLPQLELVNRQYGFNIGDEVLLAVADVIRGCVRGADCIGRYRTNEFLIVMPETAIDAAHQAGLRLLDKIADATVPVHNQSAIVPTLHVGVSALLHAESTGAEGAKGAEGSVEALLSLVHQLTCIEAGAPIANMLNVKVLERH
jgi:diguanylate cyclase (GGDEF)-like protein